MNAEGPADEQKEVKGQFTTDGLMGKKGSTFCIPIPSFSNSFPLQIFNGHANIFV